MEKNTSKKEFNKFGLCGNLKNHRGITPSDCGKCWDKKYTDEKKHGK